MGVGDVVGELCADPCGDFAGVRDDGAGDAGVGDVVDVTGTGEGAAGDRGRGVGSGGGTETGRRAELGARPSLLRG